jgi:surface polysaccharide O-acyltransferase-like enzyme
VEIVYFTVIGIGLYFFSDWLLDQIERRRGQRFAQREVIFFLIILVLAVLTFQLIGLLSRPGG